MAWAYSELLMSSICFLLLLAFLLWSSSRMKSESESVQQQYQQQSVEWGRKKTFHIIMIRRKEISICFLLVFFKVSCVSVCGASVSEPSLTVASLFWWIDANQSFQCLSRLSGRQSRLRPQRNLFIFSSRLLTHWHFETRAREKGIKVDAKTRLADGFNY